MIPPRPLGLLVAGALLAHGTLAVLSRSPAQITSRWARTNHRGAPVSLLAGPSLALAATATAALGAPPGIRLAALVAGSGSALAGGYDDLVGNRPEQRADKGFAGHIGALRQGRISAGLVKVVGVGLSGWYAGDRTSHRPLSALVSGAIVAGTANLVNLLDLRPGRALKASLLVAAPLLCGPSAGLIAGPAGAAAAMLAPDIHERVMVGDTGANALGALLGLRLALAGGPRWRTGLLAVLLGLTAASERISFTRVIESTPVLRDLDALGRLPAALTR